MSFDGYFGRSDIHKLARKVDFLQHTTFDMDNGRAGPETGMMCMEYDREPKWNSLSKSQRVELLNRYIDWTNFHPPQVDKIIDNIAAGRERSQWFNDVPMGWRGFSEREVQAWLEFEKLPEEEQLREAAKGMKRSETLGGDGVMVHAKWEEMNDRQRREVIHHELGLREGSGMLYRQWEGILKEELGYWPGKGPVKPHERFPSPSEIGRDSGPSPSPEHGDVNERGR